MKAKTVYEAMSDVLKPKSEDEILYLSADFLKDESVKAGDMMYDAENEEDFNRLLKTMKSDLSDVHMFEDWDDVHAYEQGETILRKVSADNSAPYIHVSDRDFEYAVNPKAKIAFGNSYSVGLNVIFFNYPHVINLIEKWGKSQT